MAAMMLPSLVPSILLFRVVAQSRASLGFRPMPSAVFIGGYLAAWAALGALVAVAGRFGPVDAEARHLAAAAGLLVGGAWQLTPLKARCLGHCRSPMHFFMGAWHDGPLGALRLGAHHGLYCVACCWGLMAALIALGMMQPVWMGSIALVIFAEKVLPGGQRLAPLVGLALLAAGAAMLVGAFHGSPTMGGMHG